MVPVTVNTAFWPLQMGPLFITMLAVQVAATSLSVMAIFWVVVVPRAIPKEGLLMVNVAVWVPSTNASFTTVKVTEPVV